MLFIKLILFNLPLEAISIHNYAFFNILSTTGGVAGFMFVALSSKITCFIYLSSLGVTCMFHRDKPEYHLLMHIGEKLQ